MFTLSNHICKKIQVYPNYELKLIFQCLRCFQKQNDLKVKDGSREFFKGLNFLSKDPILYTGDEDLKLCIQIYNKNIKFLKFKIYEGIIAYF